VGRIATDLPDVRLVVLVRDPVERAYSQHAHEVARGFEVESDFAQALALEPSRLRGVVERMRLDPYHYSFAHQHHAYRARGEYVTYLQRLAAPVYDEVLAFLGLPGGGYPAFARHNARPRPAPMEDAVRADLTAHYAPYDAHLAGWLGRTPSWCR
jgi:hypothetical protein